MKKFFSISFMLLVLTAMLHLTVATHYCGGNVAALKVSLTGKLASCGMENMEKDCTSPMAHLDNQCCDDVLTLYGIDTNYTPSFSNVLKSYQNNFQVLAIPVALSVNSYSDLIPLYTNVSPPDELMSTSVDLSDICVFRI